jgi:hypothetical protein
MTDAATPASAAQLDEESREALIRLVVRGMIRGAVTPELQAVVDADLAMVKGPIVMAKPEGVAVVGEMLRLPAGSEVEQSVRALFESFLPVNHRLRELCTAWQLRPDGTPNDHSDAAYDASVRDDLDDVDDKIGRVLRRLTETLPSLGHYREELTAAVERFDDGDTGALTSPLSASYHTVWMWLHQELLLMLGISRAEDERLEAELVSKAV